MKHLILLYMAALTLPASAGASPSIDVPSPANSDVDQCLVIGPEGGFEFGVVVRDIAAFPVPHATVTVAFCLCPNVQLCPLVGNEPYVVTDGCVVRGVSDINGAIRFPIRGGGVCATDDVEIRADGILLARRRVASPDQDGSGLVDAADGAILNDKLLNDPSDPTGDFDCNGTIDLFDVAIHDAHLGNMCDDHTQTTRGTWGQLKAIYR